jgi:hypothetical protein
LIVSVNQHFTDHFKRFQTPLSRLKYQKQLKNMSFLPQKTHKTLHFCAFYLKKRAKATLFSTQKPLKTGKWSHFVPWAVR